MLDDVMIGVGVDMLSEMEIILMNNPAITVELVVRITDTVEMLFEVLTVTISDENIHGLAAIVTPLKFTLPSP